MSDLNGDYVGRFEKKIPHIMAQTRLKFSNGGTFYNGFKLQK